MSATAVDVWTSIGPTGIGANGGSATGVLFHLAIPASNTAVVYVSSTTSGVWRSADHCATWGDAHGDLPILNVVGLAADAADENHVYAAIGGYGIYESKDGGGSWTKKGAPPGAFPALTDLLVDPGNAGHLYFRGQSGIYGSTDGGATWQLLLGVAASHLALGPSGGSVIYAGVPGSGIYRSSDAGANWTLLTSTNSFDIRIAPSAADQNVIYVRYRFSGAPTEIWSTTDGAATWNRQSTTTNYISVILADPTNANQAYIAGVNFWRSDDGGVTWQQKDPQHVDHHMLLTDPATPTDLYTACDGGLYRSQQAENWQFVADGIPNIEFYDLAVSATDANLVIGGTQDNGTLLTRTSQGHWSEIWGGDGGTVAIDPRDANVMYAMFQYATSVVRSADGGGSFTNIAAGLPQGSGVCFNLQFGVHPLDSNLFLACCGSLWQTEISNLAWSQIFTPPGSPSESVLCYTIARDNTYYAGTNTGRIYVGAGGTNWQLGFAHPAGAAVTDMIVDPNDAATVMYASFAAATDRVYRFDRNAAPVVVAAVSEESAARPPATLSYGLLRALGGAPGVLAPLQLGPGTLPAGLTVQTLAVDAMRPFTLYAGCNRGVYRAQSADGGATWAWRDYNAGLPAGVDVRALRVQASTGLLRAGTFGRSAYAVQTGPPVGSLLNASGRLTFLRVHDVGTGWGSPPNFLDAEVIMLLDTMPGMSFGFQLRDDAEAPTRQDMVSLLRAAFVTNTAISIDYTRTAPRVGTVIRVARINQ